MKMKLTVALLLACAFMAQAQDAGTQPAIQPSDAAAAAALGDLNATVATVNGNPLTRGQLAALALALHGDNTLEALIYSEVVRQDAAREGIKLTVKEVEDALAQRVPAELENQARQSGFKDLNEMMARTAMKPEELESLRRAMADQMRALIAPDLLARKLLRKQVSVSDAEARQEFDKRYGPRVKIAQIVLGTKAEAEEALKKAQGGADFAELARQLSIDRVSARDGGALAPMAPGSPLADAAFSLKPGEFAPVMEITGNFHVVKLLEKIPADTTASFEKLKEPIREELTERAMRARSETWLQELAKKADIKRLY